jgi:hypothetical protein
MTTEKQKYAVRFCEEVLYNVSFKGGINNFSEVSSFLSEYLEEAKNFNEDILINWNDEVGF